MQYYYCQRYCTIQKMSITSLLLVHLYLLSFAHLLHQKTIFPNRRLCMKLIIIPFFKFQVQKFLQTVSSHRRFQSLCLQIQQFVQCQHHRGRWSQNERSQMSIVSISGMPRCGHVSQWHSEDAWRPPWLFTGQAAQQQRGKISNHTTSKYFGRDVGGCSAGILWYYW